MLRGALTHRLRPSGLPGATLGFPLGEQGKISQRKLTKPQIKLERQSIEVIQASLG
jgi:hypothetical protein